MTAVLLQFAYLWAIGFCLYTSGWLILRADRNRTTMSLAACQLLIIIWCVPQLFLSLPMSREIKYLLYGISYLGISFIGSFWLLFSFFYCQRPIRLWAKILLFGVSLTDYAMFLTNEGHHFFYRVFAVDHVVYGPVFYVHMLFTYACVFLGIGVVLACFRKKQVAVLHMLVIILAAAIPLGFNLLYLSGVVKAGFDLTPPAFALSSFFMLVAVFRYDFLDIHVLAFERIFSAISEGVVVYNKRGMITYLNPAAKNWLGVKKGDDGRTLCEELERMAKAWKRENEALPGLEEEKDLLALPTGEKLRLKHYPLRNKQGEETAQILLLTDVGEYFELLRQNRELAVSEQRLAIAQERNRIAQEVHDTTGHTLTMISSLVKLSRIACEDGSGGSIEDYLNQAQELASQGIKELRCSINHLRQGNDRELVTEGIFQLTRRIKEIEVEVELQGEDGERYSHLSSVVCRCLREAVTNCLKYARATHMDVIVKFGKNDLSLYVFDNGQGCARIEEHNGIRGIRERVEKAGGQVRFISAEGEGFQMVIQLPL